MAPRTPMPGTEVHLSPADRFSIGAEMIADTNAHSPAATQDYAAADLAYSKIVVLSAATFATLTPANASELVGTWTGYAFAAGREISGRFTVIDLTSGRVMAYYGPRN